MFQFQLSSILLLGIMTIFLAIVLPYEYNKKMFFEPFKIFGIFLGISFVVSGLFILENDILVTYKFNNPFAVTKKNTNNKLDNTKIYKDLEQNINQQNSSNNCGGNVENWVRSTGKTLSGITYLGNNMYDVIYLNDNDLSSVEVTVKTDENCNIIGVN